MHIVLLALRNIFKVVDDEVTFAVSLVLLIQSHGQYVCRLIHLEIARSMQVAKEVEAAVVVAVFTGRESHLKEVVDEIPCLNVFVNHSTYGVTSYQTR